MMKYFKIYALITQGIITTILLAFGGYKLGEYLENQTLQALLTGLGTILGIIIMLIQIVKAGVLNDKR